VLSSVSEDGQGVASGANNAIRELGGVFGVAILTTIFSAYGGFGSEAPRGAGPRARPRGVIRR
jgi:hypothetical protein